MWEKECEFSKVNQQGRHFWRAGAVGSAVLPLDQAVPVCLKDMSEIMNFLEQSQYFS